MKIGILTFHTAYNYGAYMQCYSLSHKLSELFPQHDIEVIDYSSFNLMHDYEKNFFERIFGRNDNTNPPAQLILKRLAKSILNMRAQINAKKEMKKRADNFLSVRDKLCLSKTSLISDDACAFRKYVTECNYDVIIVGSDAIWNDNQTASPNLYLLHDIKNCVKMSYAASIYGMDYSCKTEEQIKYISESLNEFEYVGVRDDVTGKYVQNCTDGKIESHHNCDPSVFLNLQALPTDMQQLKDKLVAHGVDFSKPVIGLMCSDWLAKAVRKNLGESYQYVSVYTHNGYEDIFLDELNPFEWARVFSLFDVTFTHFFHGTLFSVKNGTRTFSIEKNSPYKKKYETKIQDVLRRLSLTDECYYEYEKMDRSVWERLNQTILTQDKQAVKEIYGNAIEKESSHFDEFAKKLGEILN